MKRTLVAVASVALCAAAVCTSRDAHALGPVDLEIGAKVGFASSPTSNAPVNVLGFGVGGRAGVAFLGGLYAGAKVMYYLGGSINAPTDLMGGTASESFHTLLYGAELGYGFSILDLLTIRPQLGLGNASFSSSGSSSSNLYLEPGVTGLIGLGLWYVGADANLLFFPGFDGSTTSVAINGQIGIKL